MKKKKTPDTTCIVCGSPYVEMHHVFYGTSNRAKSDKYGYIVPLCHYHHNEPPDGVHFNKQLDLYLKQTYQARFEQDHTREEFIEEFGRSYL